VIQSLQHSSAYITVRATN